jgi:hypothetical protein
MTPEDSLVVEVAVARGLTSLIQVGETTVRHLDNDLLANQTEDERHAQVSAVERQWRSTSFHPRRDAWGVLAPKAAANSLR